MGAASFNTLFVLLVFHVLSPTTNAVIGERLVDTFIGCGLALLCSYILPWWEHSFMGSLARAARKSNQAFLQAGLRYAELPRAQAAGSANVQDLDAKQHEAEEIGRASCRERVCTYG